MKNLLRIFFLGLCIIAIQSELLAQYQLIVVNGNRVVHRFKKGESFHSKWKESRQEHWGFIIDVSEFSVITSQDTIDISKVEKVLLPGRPLVNKIGKGFVTVGIIYLAIDQFNWTVVQGNDPRMDEVVWKPAAVLIGAGIPMILFRKNWAKVKKGMKIVIVDRKSRLYIPELD